MRFLAPIALLLGTATAVKITNDTTFGDLFDNNPNSHVAESSTHSHSSTSHSSPAPTRSTWNTYKTHPGHHTQWTKAHASTRPEDTSTLSLPDTTSILTLSTYDTTSHLSTTSTTITSSLHTEFSHSLSTFGHNPITTNPRTPALTPLPLARFPYPNRSGIAPDHTFRCTDRSNAAICNLLTPPWFPDSRLDSDPDDLQKLTNITLKCETATTSPLMLDVMGSLGAMDAFPDAWKCAQVYEACTEMMVTGAAKIGVCGPQGWGLRCGVVAEMLVRLLLGNCEVQGRVGGWLRYAFVEGDLWYFAYSAV